MGICVSRPRPLTHSTQNHVQEKKCEKTVLSDLPHDVLRTILTKTVQRDPNALFYCAMVNKTWQACISTPQLALVAARALCLPDCDVTDCLKAVERACRADANMRKGHSTRSTVIEHDHWVTELSFSPDGSKLATGGFDGSTLSLTEVHSGDNLGTIRGLSPIIDLSFSLDGRGLAVGCMGNALVTDVGDLSTLVDIRQQARGVNLKFSRDCTKLAVGLWDGTTHVIDLRNEQILTTFPHRGWNDVLMPFDLKYCFSPDGSKVAMGAYDGIALVADIRSGAILATIRHEDTVDSLRFSPNGQELATGSNDRTALVTQVDSGATLAVIQHQGRVNDLSFSCDGSKLATASDDHTALVTQIHSGATLATIRHGGAVRGVKFSPNNLFTLATWAADGTAWVTDVCSVKTLASVRHHEAVTTLAFSPDGNKVATGSWDHTAILTDLRSGATLDTIQHHAKVGVLSFSPDGSSIATGSWDRTAILTDYSPRAK